MTLLKSDVRSMTQQYLDDPNATLWTAANLDLLTALVLDDLWSDVLDAAPYYNCQYQQITTGALHAPGFIDLRTTTDGGDLTARLYRIQQVIADGRQYFAKDPRDYLMVAGSNTNDETTIRADTGVEQRFSMQIMGDHLYLHPLNQQTTFVELRYSFRPALWTSYADATRTVDIIPEGSEHTLILLATARAMSKGNREDVNAIRQEAEEARQRLLNSIRRRFMGMTQPFAVSNMWEWGGI